MLNVKAVFIDPEKFATAAKGRIEEFVREFIGDLCQEIVNATPVKTGFLRGSWYGEIGGGGGTIPDIDPATGKGTVGIVHFEPVVAQIKVGDVFRFINGASYAIFVEYGTSRMAPRSFVRGPLANADNIAQAAAARVGAN